MTTHVRRAAPSMILLWAMMLGLMWPGALIGAAAESDTGEVSVEIVPPGSTPKPDDPQDAPTTPAQPDPAPGILSATIMWLPDPAEGQSEMYGLVAVQDHRAQADGWTVRLLNGSTSDAWLVRVTVGGAGFGLPDWLYTGIHAWDVAVGAQLAESPQVVTAPEGTGYSLTIHQFWFDPDSAGSGGAGTMQTLVLILPFAP